MQLSLTSFAAGAAVMLVLGTGSALAATGGHVLIGRQNTGTTTTTLSDTRGTPLSLRAPSSKPPLAVSNNRLVAHLNADYVDGVKGTSLLTRTDSYKYALKAGGTLEYQAGDPVQVDLNVPADGKKDATMSAAKCPSGTIATGTGLWNSGNYPVEDVELVDAYPAAKPDGIADTAVALTPTLTTITAAKFSVEVVCYNPRGKVPAQPQASTASTAQQPGAVQQRLASLAGSAVTP